MSKEEIDVEVAREKVLVGGAIQLGKMPEEERSRLLEGDWDSVKKLEPIVMLRVEEWRWICDTLRRRGREVDVRLARKIEQKCGAGR